jgi:hypothetical protein
MPATNPAVVEQNHQANQQSSVSQEDEGLSSNSPVT